MARIRTIKPEYFRHELLQDLEVSHPHLHPMLVFAGLWGHCDKNGIFEYKPRQLKLDILPFLEYDMVAALTLLRECHLVSLLMHDGKVYGYVPSFKKHQRINGKESKDASKYPQPAEMTEYKAEERTGEAPGKHRGQQEGKGREEEGKGKEEKQASALECAFEEKRDRLKELRPNADMEMEKALILEKYEGKPVIDPGLLVLTWFQKLPINPPARAGTREEPDMFMALKGAR